MTSPIWAVEATLDALRDEARGPYVCRLARQVGRKEARYAHLLCGPVDDAVMDDEAADDESPVRDRVTTGQSARVSLAELSERVSALDSTVAELAEENAELRTLLEELTT